MSITADLIEYVMDPSCLSRKNLFGEVIRWRCEVLPFMKKVSGFHTLSRKSQDIENSFRPGK